jgi:dipeptidyl aminopeptidase/acylaminoacyl peptidase
MAAPIISPVSLSPGTRIGPYEVVGKLGEGGMGEVYRAIDSNLKRGVALKVLPQSVAADGERLSRFQREAEVLAALNHPNIAAIYGLERSGGTTALAMELVEGDDLSDRIAHGPLSPAEALPIAKQIAQAIAKDGSIIYLERQPATGSDLWTLAPNGQATPLVVTPFNDVSPDVSPDGRFVAYASDASGRSDVYVIPIGGKGAPVMASIDGGTSPMWSRDGTELFYRAGEALMSVSVNTRAGLVLGERRRLLDVAAYETGFHHDFAASPDGKRFVFIRTEPDSQPTRLNVIVNWFEELKAKAGVK